MTDVDLHQLLTDAFLKAGAPNPAALATVALTVIRDNTPDPEDTYL